MQLTNLAAICWYFGATRQAENVPALRQSYLDSAYRTSSN